MPLAEAQPTPAPRIWPASWPQSPVVVFVALPVVPLAAMHPTAADGVPAPGNPPPDAVPQEEAEFDAAPVPLAATHPTPTEATVDVPQLPVVALDASPVPLTATQPTLTDAWNAVPHELAEFDAVPVPLTAMQLTGPEHWPLPDALPVPLTASVLAHASAVGCTSAAPEHVCADADPALIIKTRTAATANNIPRTTARLGISVSRLAPISNSRAASYRDKTPESSRTRPLF